MASFQTVRPIPARDNVRRPTNSSAGTTSLWSRASTWGLLLPLLYFALDGVSPFVNGAASMRAVSTGGSALWDRLNNVLILGGCMIFVIRRHHAVLRLSGQMKLVVLFPVLALLFCPVSQQVTRTISSDAVLLGGILLVFYI
ncbi:MAG TPA: hypothetical protein VI386_13270, partial [Candidatus Sulfotelmatobacter sp.]